MAIFDRYTQKIKGYDLPQHTLDYKSKPRYSSYKERAKKRFPNEPCITQAEFNTLSSSDCFYCGKNGPNGIDRIDNNLGYSISNCVPACKHCNYVKGDLSLDDFNTWKDRFIKKQTEKG